MSTPHSGNAKDILERIARRVMQERGFLTDFSKAALDELEKISEEAKELFGLKCVNIVHRHGLLSVGDNIVFIGVSAGHRDQGFEGCRFIIDELKKRVPIWKKEYTPEGEYWVEGES